MPAPVPGSYPPLERYISLVEADTPGEAVDNYSEGIITFFKNIPESSVTHRYTEGKWSIKEMLQHLIDAERIFTYRALRIARQDKTPLPGFDENSYAAASHADARNWQSLLDEFIALRQSSDFLVKSFTPEQLLQSGITNGYANTTTAICYTMFGHMLHHINILKERYL